MGWLDDLFGLIGGGEDLAGYGDVGYSAPMDFGEYDFDLGGFDAVPSGGGIYDPFVGQDASSLSDTMDGGGSYINPGGTGGGVYDPFVGQDASSLSGTPDGGGSYTNPSALSQLLSSAASGAGSFLKGATGLLSGKGGSGGLTALLQQSPQIPGGVEGVDTYSAAPLAQPTPTTPSQFKPLELAPQEVGGLGLSGLERLLRMGGR